MPEPLKNLYNETLIGSLCEALLQTHGQFDADGFQQAVFTNGWHKKELKQRMRHISETLNAFLPENYRQALDILKTVSPQFDGFEYMFLPDYVEICGLDDFDVSIAALEYFTTTASAELAVRPFIKKYGDKMMQQMNKWSESDNYHVRRLASEGCRPRLPWAMALPEFKKDPAPVITILDKLKNDGSLYVRRSVANNLNDISKDNEDVVIDLARAWKGKHANTDWLLKHACRSLLKKGHPQVLALFGFSEISHVSLKNFFLQPRVALGERLEFSFELYSSTNGLGKLRVEYAIDFVKASGKTSRKVFKVSEADYKEADKKFSKSHSFKAITTRKYYPGLHGLAIIVNGKEMAGGTFELYR